MLDDIKKAEEKASEVLEKAREDADARVQEAKKEAEHAFEVVKSAAREQQESAVSEAEKKAEEDAKVIVAKAETAIAADEKNVSGNIQKVAASLFESITK